MDTNAVIIMSQLVEAQVTGTPATGRRYPFLEIPNLSRNNLVVYAIEAFGYGQLNVTPNGNAILGGAATSATPTQTTVVTLLDNRKNQFVYQIPYFSLIRTNNGGDLVYLQPRQINLTDCFIQLTSTTNVAASEVAAFNIYYYLT